MRKITLFVLSLALISLAQDIQWTGEEGGVIEVLNTNFDDNSHTLFRPSPGQTVRRFSCGSEGSSISPSGPAGSLTWSINGLPSFTQVYVRIRFGFIDSWENEEAFITINGADFWRKRSTTDVGHHVTHVCGRTTRTDELETIIRLFALPAPSTSLNIVIGSNLDQGVDNEFFVVSEFVVYIVGARGPPSPVAAIAGLAMNVPVTSPSVPAPGGWNRIYASSFRTSTAGWTDQNKQPVKNHFCNSALGTTIRQGGPGGSLQWTSSDVSPFQKVRVSFTLGFIDSWDGEALFIRINGKEVWRQTDISNGDTHKSELCGRTNEPPRTYDRSIPVQVQTDVPAGTTKVTLLVGATLDQDITNESFVLKDVVVEVSA